MFLKTCDYCLKTFLLRLFVQVFLMRDLGQHFPQRMTFLLTWTAWDVRPARLRLQVLRVLTLTCTETDVYSFVRPVVGLMFARDDFQPPVIKPFQEEMTPDPCSSKKVLAPSWPIT